MHITLIEITRTMYPAVLAALAVSLAASGLARARRRLARIAWPVITIELRFTLARGRATGHEHRHRTARRAAQRERTQQPPKAASRRR